MLEKRCEHYLMYKIETYLNPQYKSNAAFNVLTP